jgi:hypothetical protein
MPWLGVLVVLLTSCRTAQPDLRPKKIPEVCSDPPTGDRRYDTIYYPKEAFKDMKDPMQKATTTPNMTAGGMSPGGMGAGGMMPGRPGY